MIAANTLDEGVRYVEQALGVPLANGGEHAAMGTHNKLLHLGPGVYLEVIAINPKAPAQPHARWYDLDCFTGAPRLTNWAAQVDDLDAAIDESPSDVGAPMDLVRGDLRWRMAVPGDGKLPFDGAFPGLIEWKGAAHPAERLPDVDCRLKGMEIAHPKASELRLALTGLLDDPRVAVVDGPAMEIRAHIQTPAGEVVLS